MLPPSTQPPQATDEHAPTDSPTSGHRSDPAAPRAAADTVDYHPSSSSSPPADLVADLAAAFGDRFTLEKALGQGGFGSVFEAFDRRLGRRVAIKATGTRSKDPDKLLREARALAQLRHPGIVGVYDVAVAGGYCFVVSELLPGPSLADWIKDRLPAPAEAARVVAEVADALAHAHARSIVHRDLKPSNVVFADGGRPVLVDFGLALSDQEGTAERGVVSGTPAYMSPEQAAGRAHRPDGRTDVYGLAGTLYTLLCGQPPFRAQAAADILRQVREDEPTPPRQFRPEVPVAIEAACLKGLAKLPGDRFTTVADFASALRRAVGLLPQLDRRPGPAPAGPSAAVPRPAPRGPRAERRPVTLVQFTCGPASTEDDPTEQVGAFQAACAAAVADHGGMAIQSGGTGYLACFGYPTAHEDAPRRAVRAALAVCPPASGASAAVGTGIAIVAEDPGTTPTVVGDVTAAVAAIAVATVGGVTITAGTHRLVGEFFETSPAGEVWPRGSAAVGIYRVTAERAVRSRVDAADPARLSPLVGRDREVALLRERWELAAEGVRNVILLVGDPGLGKSRLVRTLTDFALDRDGILPADSGGSGSAVAGPAAAIEWYCSPYHQGSPFYPIIDYFDRTYGLGREPDPARRLDRLVDRLRTDGVHDPADLALFAAMLSVPAGDRLPKLALSPEGQKERTLDALLGWLSARAETSPVLFVVEDLHWVDPSTEALLTRFVEDGGEARVLGVFTFRPEYDPPWRGKAVQTQVALNRLTRSQVGELVRAQAGPAVQADVVERIAERTDGVPLFVEEFTRLLAEGVRDGLAAAIPASLQDLLLARLDRMASDREVVQLGATIGRTFGYPLIRASTDRDEAALRAELRKLVDAGLLFAKGTIPRVTYTFKHALIQDAAYQSLVKKTRQQLHRRVAAALEGAFPEVVETQPELVAHHLTEAGETARSLVYWRTAGERARGRSAHLEAIRHFTRGLQLLATQPEGADRDAEELQLRLPLSASYIAVRGYAAPEVEEHIQRARALCEQLGPGSPLFHVMMIIWAVRFIRGESDAAVATSKEVLDLARDRDDGYKAEAFWSRCSCEWWAGEFERSLELSTRGVAVYSPEASRSHAAALGQNCGPLMTCYVAWTYWLLGDPARGREWQQQALVLAEGLNDKFSLVVTRWQVAFFFALGGWTAEARALAEQVIATSIDESYAFWLALGLGLRGTTLAQDGRPAEGAPFLRDAVAGCDAIGSGILHTYFLGQLATALWRSGNRREAKTALARGLDHNDRLGQRAFEAELHRARAEFVLEEGDAVAAEAELQVALGVARRQRARMFELRAALGLARLWTAGGRGDDGRRLVAELLAGVPAEADCPDIAAARTFLSS
ncbi:MAG TPA: protein kinase [Gemmataceae bacterium]|nr:protein kinase [Gemmataceae bacterium]